jgi:hypothetical protein
MKGYRALYSYMTNFAHLIKAESEEEAHQKAEMQDGPEYDEYTNGSELIDLIPLDDGEVAEIEEILALEENGRYEAARRTELPIERALPLPPGPEPTREEIEIFLGLYREFYEQYGGGGE